MSDTLEMLDLVDEEDVVIDTLSRDEIYAKDLKYVRVIETFIKNIDGKLWIPVRVSTKRIAPNGFDVGAGGHVEHGETYEEAFRKEVGEELDINVDNVVWREVGKFTPKDGLNTVSMVYEIEMNEVPHFNPEDFSSYTWMLPAEVVTAIDAGHPAKTNLKPLLHLVYGV